MLKFISISIVLAFGAQAMASPIENWVSALPDETSTEELLHAMDQMSPQDRDGLLNEAQANPEYSRVFHNVKRMLQTEQLNNLSDLKTAAIAGQQTAFIGPIIVGAALVAIAVCADWIVHCRKFMKEHPRAPMCMR